jgi:2-keto-4-pentenoate hydratase/2-oxohepta-3-ene-1,7-dioic acid hydratase in catechol pathway
MAASILCRFIDADGNTLVGQPTATDAESGLPTECLLLNDQEAGVFGDLALAAEKKAVAKVLAPLDPKTILCIGLNYAKHAA